jgi:ADP-ribose pyrophosphatase YjhB (NUDIX family)
MSMNEIIGTLESYFDDPHNGLPEPVFLFISRITPLINVDLLIKDKDSGTLLTWRDDGYSAPGWHIPGGIIRFKEEAADRIKAVARTELGAEVTFDGAPLAIKEIIHPTRKERGHFISLLYRCSLTSAPMEDLRYTGDVARAGVWMWHATCPDDLLDVHEMYREFIDARFATGDSR